MADETRAAMFRRLYHNEGCSIEELSAFFGCTRGDVRSQIVTWSSSDAWPAADRRPNERLYYAQVHA